MRVPAIEDQHRAILVAAVPRLMLDRVVKANASPSRHDRVSPPTRNPQSSGTISGRWMMVRILVTPVCGGIVLPALRIEKKTAGDRPGNLRQRERLDQLRGPRRPFAHRVDPLPVAPQMECAPVGRTVELAPQIARGSGRHVDVRRKTRIGTRQDCLQLLPDRLALPPPACSSQGKCPRSKNSSTGRNG